MRNLLEYPLTKEEIVTTLRNEARHHSEMGGIGDITPVCLEAAAQIVEASFLMIEEINRRLDDKLVACPLRYTTPWAEATKLLKAQRSQP